MLTAIEIWACNIFFSVCFGFDDSIALALAETETEEVSDTDSDDTDVVVVAGDAAKLSFGRFVAGSASSVMIVVVEEDDDDYGDELIDDRRLPSTNVDDDDGDDDATIEILFSLVMVGGWSWVALRRRTGIRHVRRPEWESTSRQKCMTSLTGTALRRITRRANGR